MSQENLNFSAFSNSLPPQNIEAEESILGGILLDPEAISRVADLLYAEAFYIKAHQEIYKAALTLHSQGKPTDLMSVATWLYDRELLEKVGGESKLAQLVERTVSTVNIDRYAVLVMDKYLRRRLIQVGNEIAQLGYETATELEIVLDQAEQKIFSLTQTSSKSGLTPIAETLIQTFQEIETRHQGVALPGLPSNFYDLDAITGGFQRSDLVIVAGRPSMGKCLSNTTEIVSADGSVDTIEIIYHRRQGQLLSLGKDWKFHFTAPTAFVDDGIKAVYKVTTSLGRYVESTITHPYLTINGWRQLSELKVGDKIAVPRQIDIFGTVTLPKYKVKGLAYRIGNDCLTRNSPELVSQELAAISKSSKNNLILWLQELGLGEKNSQVKFIPSIVFRLERSLLALFLNRLFARAGWVKVLKSGQAQLGYATVSEKLARQVQHLLLRFGVVAALNKQFVKDSDIQLGWQLDITDTQSIKTFISEIGILGQEEVLSSVQDTLAKNTYQFNGELIPAEIWQQILIAKGSESWLSLVQRAGIEEYSNIPATKRALLREQLFQLALALDNLPLQQLAASDVYWDEIIAIEPVGYKQVYDLTIPETHNFVANDICVHNTSFALGIARNIAEQSPVAVFSLEMSKEQLVQRLLASEAGIESNYLRTGRISQNQWEPLSHALGTLSELPIFIDDTANPTVMQMRSQLRRLQAEQGGKLGLVLIDYLQLMEGSGSENRVQELSRITRSLKGLARELHVPIIVLSQLSRGVETRNNKRPMMSDLRESGSIEQDADLIIMLYRDEYYSPDTPDRGIAEVIITKHRNGPTGTVKVLFKPEFTKFLNMANKPNY
ncbi:MAG TPA: replicative DNA helicase [Cyanobacteria bacterium UBA8803]|nr:replicative DNA helicase [Cyanobacteria bacterium UBA9273]HBL60697.1 replicative DNA helicase [Cyanobacteria bacterium UBA8803]